MICYKCHNKIKFNTNIRSNGKAIPLDYETNEIHNCMYSSLVNNKNTKFPKAEDYVLPEEYKEFEDKLFREESLDDGFW